MGPEDAKDGTKRAPGHEAGGVLHQRRKLPYSPATMALGGFLIVAGIGYVTLYAKKKPEARARDVAKAAANAAHPKDTHPREAPPEDRSRK
ncbi:hypothetical protein IFM89_003127 [Coptis chinensis]|uniref:Uncharacterized protein n=1 Tax=Coptis chinensis TaxID=261450 RepID=A0A835M191_9MAGN|nr:hypothetical protein IFM89_003127 [Coptis chinensis]